MGLLSLTAGHVGAQAVRGALTDTDVRSTVAGALVVLEDEAGAEHVFGIADSDGGFTLRSDSPGRYRLRVDRVGYESLWTGSFDLGVNDVREFQIPLPAVAITLHGLGGSAAFSCTAAHEMTPPTAMVWAEARKALISAWLIDDARLLRYEVVAHESVLEDSLPTADAAQATGSWVDIHPLASGDQRWLDEGFVRTSARRTAFQAPVPAILIAGAFADRHCFQAVVGPDSARDLMGVAFLPRDTLLPDVGGTVWLDVETGALRSVDYEYLYLPAGLEERDPRGHLEFARLADGSWYIDHWWLRQTTTTGDSVVTSEVGRTITSTAPVFGDVGPRETQIAGVLFDSIRGQPLAGAAVFLWGTDYQTTSDALGRFAFDRAVPPGDYSVSFYHDALAAWGVIPERVPATATTGADTWTVLSVPSAVSIVAQRCEGQEGATLVGSVREAGAGFTLPRARVVLDWSETSRGNVKPGRRVGRADSRGWYYFCELPVGLPIIARAQFNDEWTSGNTFIPVEGAPSVEHLMVAVVDRVTASGRVMDSESGAPIVGASVGLVGLQGRYFSDSTGAFVFGDVVPGFYELSIVHRDYGAVSDSITIRESGTAEFEVLLSAAAPADALSVRSVGEGPDYVLQPIIVEGKAVDPSMAPFYRRRAAGFGGFITREEFERFIPSDVTDVLRRMPSIAVRPNPTYDRMLPNGMVDTRRYRIEVTTRARRTAVQECAPIVFLDGAYLGNTREIDVDVLPVDAIEAMETYALSASVPPEFNRSGAVCGVIALWTRR